jgi:uncharacterized protein YndB with AHSA1/START domain
VLIVRRTIRAGVQAVFEAWTRPEHLRAWWGPRPVRCAEAAVDLRVGGQYRIVNQLPDGARLTIEGRFTVVDPPHRLGYTWSLTPGPGGHELVTVRFERRDAGTTEVIVTHEQIATPAARDSHERGWEGCLDGLALHLAGAGRAGG